jgi:hypothetical protein
VLSSSMPDDGVWRKSSHSADASECVEVAHKPGFVSIRDSDDPAGPRLIFGVSQWVEFIHRIRTGSS